MEPAELKHPLLKVVPVASAASCVVENLSCIKASALHENLTGGGLVRMERTLTYCDTSEHSSEGVSGVTILLRCAAASSHEQKCAQSDTQTVQTSVN